MTRLAQAGNWITLIVFGMAVVYLERINPSSGPADLAAEVLFLAPWVTALVVLHLGAPRWLCVIGIVINGLFAALGLAMCVLSILGAAAYPLAAALFLFVFLLGPAVLNVLALRRCLQARNPVPAC